MIPQATTFVLHGAAMSGLRHLGTVLFPRNLGHVSFTATVG